MRTTSCSVCRGQLCHFFIQARCECLLPLPYGPPNPCQILKILVPNGADTPRRALSKSAQGQPGAPQEIDSGSALQALWTRFGTIWGAKWEQNEAEIDPRALQVVSGRVSHAHFGEFPKLVGKAKMISWGGFAEKMQYFFLSLALSTCTSAPPRKTHSKTIKNRSTSVKNGRQNVSRTLL